MAGKKRIVLIIGSAALILIGYLLGISHVGNIESRADEQTSNKQHTQDNSLQLTAEQLKTVQVQPVEDHVFMAEREAVGNIAFDDERTVQVFPPYAGKIIQIFAKAGDEVKQGTVLYTINSPDLVQAESTLISTAGVLKLTTQVLQRDKQLLTIKGIAQKDYQQAVSDQQTAEGAYNAARKALHIFDFADPAIDRIIASRRVSPIFPVRSPIAGNVTIISRNAAVGLIVQPGNAPAPFSVSDTSKLLMIANVDESDIPMIHLGQDVEVKVMAYPNRVFSGKVTNIGSSVDPNTHRVQVRSEIMDHAQELRPGMFATFRIRVGETMKSPAIPLDGVVRENDGSISIWVTTDKRRFVRKTVTLGQQQDGFYQVLSGLSSGELVASEGALFLSNALIAEEK